MHIIFNKKSAVVGLVAAIAVAATAFGFLTTTGEGTGTGTASASVSELVLTAPGGLTLENLGDAETVDVYATNPGANAARMTSLDVTVGRTGCPPASFEVTNETVTGVDVQPGADAVKVGSATVTFKNLPNDNQDACAGALSLALSN